MKRTRLVSLLTLMLISSGALAAQSLDIGDEVEGTGDCRKVALNVASEDYDAKNPGCMWADPVNSPVTISGEAVSVALFVVGGGGHSSCGGASGDGYEFTILPSRPGTCKLRLEAFTWN
jgi:hypothetical protein